MNINMMKAAITTKYGTPEVIKIVEVERPTPQKKEVLIKIKAIAVTSGDCRIRALDSPFWYFKIPMRIMLGLKKPRKPIQGLWLSGEIVETGCDVKKLAVSQQIYARTLDMNLGANAEYICLPEDCIIGLKPNNLTYEEAVSIPFGALSALYFLEKVNIKKDDKILIYGASGAVGIAAVQLARFFRAETHAVCSSANTELVKLNGADYTVDYTKQNISELNYRFDIVFDAVGKINKSIAKSILKERGKFVSVLSSGHCEMEVKKLLYLTKLIENNVLKPVVDKCFPFDQIVDAHKYVDSGRKKGNVVISMSDECSYVFS